jgi:hypothetical protein
LADPTEQHDQRGRALPRLFKRRVRQNRVLAVAVPTPVAGKSLPGPKQPTVRASTTRTAPSGRMEIRFQPAQARRLVHKVGDGEVNHAPILSYDAR